MSTKNKVLVAGASGLVGVAATESFLAAGWDVVGISRRKPELPSGRDFQFISVDLRDDKAAHQAHVAYAAIYENAHDLVGGWSNAAQIEVNDAMLRNVIEPLLSGKAALKRVSILQGTKAYGVHLHPIAIPARENDSELPQKGLKSRGLDDVPGLFSIPRCDQQSVVSSSRLTARFSCSFCAAGS
jgi:nucleoside-diphosphate-sugar epimerase